MENKPLTLKSVIRDSRIQEVDDDDIDVELMSPTRTYGINVNTVPLISAVQPTRSFYAARFVNQALPLVNPETPLVQSTDPEDKDGKSFDEILGARMGAKFFDEDGGEVVDVTPDNITVKLKDGSKKDFDLYNSFSFNRKTSITNTPSVKPGDKVKKGQLLARSNYTDDKGAMAMGVNAKIAVVPYEGYSMDDAIVISEGFAKKLTSDHMYELGMDKDRDTKFNTNHFKSLFPDIYTKDVYKNFSEDGIVQPGTVLQKGDPLILATKPKTISSTASSLGKLGKVMRMLRGNASQVWDHEYPGVVEDSIMTSAGPKVFIKAQAPAEVGDKLTIRNGQKSIISKIIPDNKILQDSKGNPFEVLLNPLSFPSRVNAATPYEIMLGKVAEMTGKPIKLNAFTKKGETWDKIVEKYLSDAGTSDTEKVYDPDAGFHLENPIATGNAYVHKLHHMVDSKISYRGQGSYDNDEQPAKGGYEGAQAKRLGGLEATALLSSGAYNVLREGSTLRGQKNDEYWRAVRQGYKPPTPGAPFVWQKFQTLLNGAGYSVRDKGNGILRLSPFTDKDLAEKRPVIVQNGKLVDPDTLEPSKGGLFDKSLVSGDKWGIIPLPKKYPNPAFEKQIQQILGITQDDLRQVLARKKTLRQAMEKAASFEEPEDLFNKIARDAELGDISRKGMPQLDSKEVHNSDDIETEDTVIYMSPNSLRMSQKAVNEDKVKGIMKNWAEAKKNPVIVSKDNFIIDGHHRVEAAKRLGNPIKVVRVKMTGKKALKELKEE